MSSLRSRTATKKKAAVSGPRSWTVSLLRSRGYYLGIIDALDAKAAEAAAIREFKLDPEQRKHLLVRERG
jgi:hypothetical protein